MPSYDHYERRRRQTYTSGNARGHTWGHWLPLAITFTVAAGGLAAWIWKERKDNEDDEYEPRPPPPGPPAGYVPPPEPGYGPPPGAFQDGPPPGTAPPLSGQPPYVQRPETREAGEESIMTRMSGALRRTPSPQEIIGGASKKVTAGMAAAGAAIGGALSSITEEDRRDYEDHRSWSEERDSQSGGATSRSSRKGPNMVDNEGSTVSQQTQIPAKDGKRKSVAIVVSSVTDYEHDHDASYHQEHASILSHLPEHIDTYSRIFVLIYSPDLKQHPLSTNGQDGQPSTSMTSSFSNIGHEDAQSPPKTSPEIEIPKLKMFDTLYTQAQAIVEKETMIMPFSTLTGYIPMLRHLGPETVYLQASLAGDKGQEVDQIKSWVDQIVLVVGDDSGHGGLVDSEDEHGTEENKWWVDDSRIGLGKGVEVVDGLRVGEDFRRRVSGHD